MVSNYTLSLQKQQILQRLMQSRSSTLSLVAGLDPEIFRTQAHSDFSPVGWHFGHIGYTESVWLLRRCAKLAPIEPSYDRLFAADSLPKRERTNLPTYAEICDYLKRIRQDVCSYLEEISDREMRSQEKLWYWLVQHESQHCETIAIVLQMLGHNRHPPALLVRNNSSGNGDRDTDLTEMVQIPAGSFVQGYSAIDALDNELGEHQVDLPTYWLDRYPVTRAAYQEFIDADGYKQQRWWSDAGWQWLESYRTEMPSPQPLYWQSWAVTDEHPVCGASWYEADAYARFRGKRLPTEAEWEKAARWNPHMHRSQIYPWGDSSPEQLHCNHNQFQGMTTPVNAFPLGQSAYGCYDMLGNVWEWTASLFQPYPAFSSFPYPGYSSTYFDRSHYVLKGGSWATRPWALRVSFRNWYYPHVRQIFAGFRCARDA
ncbi:DinB family protein [Pseudanabaena sp. PCC 6802]|uniref:DinB family protein n=1 Tax=Pseudanabaena sp. PCC 6802 TaxID=118173 RepID=UPI000380BAC5|nr:DinB family protein [Pseudanabaena sp. PCC 6802]